MSHTFHVSSLSRGVVTAALVSTVLCHAGCAALKISRIDGGSQGQLTCSAASPRGYFSHALIVVLENEDFKDASKAEYLGGLVAEYGGREFTNFQGLFHHSYPNYLAMVGGRLFPEVSSRNNHYNVLRTIEDNFGLAPMADGDAMAIPILGIWANETKGR